MSSSSPACGSTGGGRRGRAHRASRSCVTPRPPSRWGAAGGSRTAGRTAPAGGARCGGGGGGRGRLGAVRPPARPPGRPPAGGAGTPAAGRRKVIMRQYEAERRQQLLLVVDTGRLMTADIAGTARLDYAVRAALELAYAAAQHDDNVGVMAFADGVKHYVAPQRGRVGLKRALDVLAVLEPVLVEPDYPGAFRYLAARSRKRALTVLFTAVIARFASDALVANVASLRPRHLPLAVTLRNPELDRVAALRPETPPDAFRKAAAEELLRARDEALGHMRRAGVLVLDVPPERAAHAVVAGYLDLKRRGRL